MSDETFGFWLNQQLADRVMDQVDLANFVGVSETAVSRWINKGVQPKLKACELIAAALGLEFEDVARRAGHSIGGDHPVEPHKRSLQEIAAELLARIREEEAAYEYEGVPVTAAGSAGQERVVLAEDEVVLPSRRLKKLPGRRVALEIVGDCLEPQIPNGGVAVVDPDIAWRPGQTIALRHNGGVQVKRLIAMGDGRLVLGSRYGEMIVPETDTRIVGTVVAYQGYLEV